MQIDVGGDQNGQDDLALLKMPSSVHLSLHHLDGGSSIQLQELKNILKRQRKQSQHATQLNHRRARSQGNAREANQDSLRKEFPPL